MAEITSKQHMQIIKSLGKNPISTDNINFGNKAFSYINFYLDFSHPFVKNKMEVFFKSNIMPNHVHQSNKDILIPKRIG